MILQYPLIMIQIDDQIHGLMAVSDGIQLECIFTSALSCISRIDLSRFDTPPMREDGDQGKWDTYPVEPI